MTPAVSHRRRCAIDALTKVLEDPNEKVVCPQKRRSDRCFFGIYIYRNIVFLRCFVCFNVVVMFFFVFLALLGYIQIHFVGWGVMCLFGDDVCLALLKGLLKEIIIMCFSREGICF